ncbi:unnamed protein product, partial [Schistosoma turkestanicum]
DRIILQKNKVELLPSSSSSSLSTNMIESVENQMRHLIQADCMRIVEMKKSNHLLLPDQQQQQPHSNEELEGAMMQNHTELMPKTRFNPIGVDTSNSIEIGGGDGVGVGVDDTEDESDSDHLEDIENICGYGKKDDIKPGTVEDALSILTSLTTTTTCTQSRSSSLVSGTLQHSLPVNKDTLSLSGSMHTPNSHATHYLVNNKSSTSQQSSITATQSKQLKNKKKKCPPPSKHIAKIGAQAEAKHRQTVVSSNNNNNNSSNNSNLHDPIDTGKLSRCKRDDMEAFLFNDSDVIHLDTVDKDNILPEGGRNRERVIEKEVNARKAAAVDIAKQRQDNLEQRKQQQEKADQRRQTANKRAQKVEKRRL